MTNDDRSLTWFLLPTGEIDEIAVIGADIGTANTIARQLRAGFYWCRVAQYPGDLSFKWACYRTTHRFTSERLRGRLEPFRTLRAHDSAPAEMLCRALAAKEN